MAQDTYSCLRQRQEDIYHQAKGDCQLAFSVSQLDVQPFAVTSSKIDPLDRGVFFGLVSSVVWLRFASIENCSGVMSRLAAHNATCLV